MDFSSAAESILYFFCFPLLTTGMTGGNYETLTMPKMKSEGSVNRDDDFISVTIYFALICLTRRYVR